MVIESKDEVYVWFKGLSGAHRIEVLSAMLSNCIPLECRFFASLIEKLARQDYCTLLDDEHVANSPSDLEAQCSADWLADVPKPALPVDSHNGLLTHNRRPLAPELSGKSVDSTPVLLPPDRAVRDVVPAAGVSFPATDPPLISLRSKVIVSICLLKSTNRVCATIIFKAIQKHLSVNNLKHHLQVHCKERGKEKLISQTAPEHQVVAEINLLFTLVLCHPAFSFEQQSLLGFQMQKVREYLDSLGTMAQSAPLYYHSHFQQPVPISFPLQTYYPITDPVAEPKVKSCYNCGASGHLGQECRAETLDDMTGATDFNLNLAPEVAQLTVAETEPQNGPPAFTNHLLTGRTSHPISDSQSVARPYGSRDDGDDRGKLTHGLNQRDHLHDRIVSSGDQSGS